MSYLETSKTKKFVASFVGLAVALSLSLGVATPALAATVDELTAQINSLLGTITSLQSQLSAMNGGSSTSGFTFSKNLSMGASNSDVMQLQKVLNMSADTQVSASGAGSPGNESSYFGAKTKAAVVKYQAKKGISPTSGFVGPLTRAALNAGVVVTPNPTPGPNPAPAPAGTGLSVMGGTQPAAQLAPLGAARVPFTNVTFTAGNDGDVTVSGVVVERGGPSTDAAFSGVVLLDENGTQIGIAKTLNSTHQTTLPGFVVPKGTSRTLTVAGNRRTTDASSVDAGAVAAFSVVAVNTSATVSGSLPIVGTAQVLNDGLVIGSVTVARGPLDPAAQAGGVSKNVGTTAYIFSSLKVTAGSVEDVLVKSVRWNQASSTSSSDLANVVALVDGVSYPTTIDSTGKYYTATFGAGIKIEKGFSKEFSIRGDIVGGSGRTVAFNIEKTTDLNVNGLSLGYGITPPTSGTGISAGTIWFPGSTVTVNSGSITVSSDSSVASQNIAINVSNQPIGGYQVEVKGEPITVAQMIFNVGASNSGVTNVTLVNQNGAVLAGPVDISSTNPYTATFTDTITFPIGITKLVLKGKLGTSFSNNQTVTASTTPSSQWSTITGQVTGQTISAAPGSAVTSNTMTVKSAALTISVSASPIAQSVVSGGQGFVFANYQLDASASGEDIRLSALSLAYTTTGTATNLTNCQLWDGATSITTGSNAVNPSAGVPTNQTFTFDNALVIAKGTMKNLALKCNIATGSTGTHNWGVTATQSATGVTSGQSVTISQTNSNGQIMTLTSGGAITVALDSSNPSYRIVAAGTTGNIASVLRFHATNEDMTLQTIGLQLSSTTASTNADVTNVTLWDGTTQIGTASFNGSSLYATSTLTQTVVIPKDGDKLVTVKVDLANHGTSSSGHPGALVAIDADGTDSTATKASGASSGTTVYATGSDTATPGMRVFKSLPTITYSTAGGSLVTGSNDLLSVTIAAGSSGNVFLRKLTFTVSTSTATLDSATFSGPSGNVQASSTLDLQSVASGAANVTVVFDSTSNTADREIGAGTSKTYTLRGAVTITGNTNQNGSVSVALKADAGFPAFVGTYFGVVGKLMSSSTILSATASSTYGSNIIWSPESTTTSVTAATNDDFTNGYGLPGCFSTSGLGQNCTARVLSK